MNKSLNILFTVLLAASLCGCGSNADSSFNKENNIVSHADNLYIEDFEGYTKVSIRNPWDTTRILARYLLVDSGANLPENMDFSSYIRVNVPLKNSIVYSNIHCSLINELGMSQGISGVCDADFITDSLISHKVTSGEIADCGLSTSPNIERIMQIRPDAILLSPMGNNQNHGKLESISVPLIQTADYLEKTPLGRAEWMKFYGRLYGKGHTADSIFNIIASEYDTLKDKVKDIKRKPTVLIDGVYGQVWSVPTAGSVTGTLIQDAGGVNPFDNLTNAGSAQLSPEEVLFKGADADIWIVRYYADKQMTLRDWSKKNKNYQRFKAFKSDNVYGSNTKYSGYFDDAAFHPHWILADMISVLHPEINNLPQYKSYLKKFANK